MRKVEVLKEKKAAAFTKEQLLESKRYENQKDLVMALLAEGEAVTLEEMDQRIQAFRKGRVK